MKKQKKAVPLVERQSTPSPITEGARAQLPQFLVDLMQVEREARKNSSITPDMSYLEMLKVENDKFYDSKVTFDLLGWLRDLPDSERDDKLADIDLFYQERTDRIESYLSAIRKRGEEIKRLQLDQFLYLFTHTHHKWAKE